MFHSMRQFKADVFQALAHPTRVGIVEQLRLKERSVGELCEILGVEQANMSQHLALLRAKQLVLTRKDGNQSFYRLRDPLLGEVVESLRKYFLAHMTEAMALVKQEQRSASRSRNLAKETVQ